MEVDKVSIDLKKNPEFAAAIAGASPGDTLTFKNLEVCIDEIASDLVVGSVCDWDDVSVSESKDEDDSGTGEASEEAAAPVISVMSQGYESKSKKK